MANWFGNLDLAYKYIVVFLSILFLTILAGLVKVFLDRRKLKKFDAKQKEEDYVREEQMELNGRERDEGDLFGVRALEAGFYAGIAQSRPTSRAGSIAGSPCMSASTLVGGVNSPKVQSHSVNSSVSTLPLAHTKDGKQNSFRDSDTLPSPMTPISHSPHRRKTPPTIRLAPSEAELSGRHNHNASVNISLHVPPSPVTNRSPSSSPTFGGSDSGESDGRLSPHSPRSPNSASFPKPEHYAPKAPQLPVLEGLRASFESVHEPYQSQAGSLVMESPGSSAPASPALPPEAKSSTPGIVLNGTGSSSSPPPSCVTLLPKTYQPSHQRDDSDSSSIYSERRRSIIEPEFPTETQRTGVAVGASKEKQRKSAFLAPGTSSEGRYSEIYDAYYRQSMLNAGGVSTRLDELCMPKATPLAFQKGTGMAI